jgi:hypothetical protein
MTVHVFVGPTISPDEIRAAGDFVCNPPVAQGDVYRAVHKRPRAIGLIDGYFEGVPSVWHKEILWAMSEGVHVFGSASMGALRAAELHDFGMRGIGQIFEAYRDGTLEDDDEVAVLHGPAEAHYVALSEPMVNIRATLEQAVTERVIAITTRTALEHRAKSLFYQERTWDTLFAASTESSLPTTELAALRDWLPSGRIDLKASDARAMLSQMREFLATDPGPAQVSFAFEWTDMWDTAAAGAQTIGSHLAQDPEFLPTVRLLDELRLDAGAYRRAKQDALSRMLAVRESSRQRLGVDHAAKSAAANSFRAKFGLFNRANVDCWFAENDLNPDEFERLMEEEARIEALEFLYEPAIERHLLDHLRVSNQYLHLARRALHKHKILDAAGLEDAQPGDTGLTPPQLAVWFFERRLGRAIPEDLVTFARGLGLANQKEFYRLLAREYLFSNRSEVSLGDEASAD